MNRFIYKKEFDIYIYLFCLLTFHDLPNSNSFNSYTSYIIFILIKYIYHDKNLYLFIIVLITIFY